MTTPLRSVPTLFTPPDLKSDPALTAQITSLANNAFGRSKLADPEKWSTEPRFQTPEIYHDMLDDESIVAVIFDESIEDEHQVAALGRLQENGKTTKEKSRGKVVACAAAVPWKGGWAKEGAGTEDGFEIKVVCVDDDPKYLRRGLAIQVMDSLENHLIKKARLQLQNCTVKEANGTGVKVEENKGRLTLWILAAECINGVYWRKRGYREVRRSTEVNGTWCCKTSFDLVVFRKDVLYDLAA